MQYETPNDAQHVDFLTPTSETGLYVHNLPEIFDYDDAVRLFSPFGALFMVKITHGAGAEAMRPACCVVRFYVALAASTARQALHRRTFRGCSLVVAPLRPMLDNRIMLSPGQCLVLAQYYCGLHRVSTEVLELDCAAPFTDIVPRPRPLEVEAWATTVRVHLLSHFVDGYAVAHVRDSLDPLPDLACRLKFLRQHSHRLAVQAAFSKVRIQIAPVVKIVVQEDTSVDFSSCLRMDAEFASFATNEVDDPSDMAPQRADSEEWSGDEDLYMG